MNGNVAVDDMAILALYTKSIEDAVYNLLRITHTEVVAFLLLEHHLVCQEVAFKRGHLRLVEEGRVLATPQIEEVVACIESQFLFCIALKCRTHHHANVMHQVFAAVALALVQLHFF